MDNIKVKEWVIDQDLIDRMNNIDDVFYDMDNFHEKMFFTYDILHNPWQLVKDELSSGIIPGLEIAEYLSFCAMQTGNYKDLQSIINIVYGHYVNIKIHSRLDDKEIRLGMMKDFIVNKLKTLERAQEAWKQIHKDKTE